MTILNLSKHALDQTLRPILCSLAANVICRVLKYKDAEMNGNKGIINNHIIALSALILLFNFLFSLAGANDINNDLRQLKTY